MTVHGERGRPKFEDEKRNVEKVLGCFPLDGSEITYKELKQKAKECGVSPRSLDRHLDRLEERGVIERRVDTTRWPPKVSYSITMPAEFEPILRRLPLEFFDVRKWANRLAGMKDDRARKITLGLLLEFWLRLLEAEVACAWGSMLKVREPERVKAALDRLCTYYIEPMIKNLGLLSWGYRKEADEVLTPILKRCLEHVDELRGQFLAAARLFERSSEQRPPLRGGGDKP